MICNLGVVGSNPTRGSKETRRNDKVNPLMAQRREERIAKAIEFYGSEKEGKRMAKANPQSSQEQKAWVFSRVAKWGRL